MEIAFDFTKFLNFSIFEIIDLNEKWISIGFVILLKRCEISGYRLSVTIMTVSPCWIEYRARLKT